MLKAVDWSPFQSMAGKSTTCFIPFMKTNITNIAIQTNINNSFPQNALNAEDPRAGRAPAWPWGGTARF